MPKNLKKNNIPRNYVALKGSERRPSPKAKLLGPADAKETFSVTIVLRRRPGGPAVPPPAYFTKPPGQRRRMPENEFAAKYGASPADIGHVTKFAQEHGLTLVETNAARRSVVVSGTVAQMSEAFAVTLGRYRHTVVRSSHEKPRSETYRGRDGFIHVPKALADLIVGVFGLDNRRITKCGSGDPPNTNSITIPQVRGLYQFPTNTAAGQTIAIFSERGYQLSDVTNYFGTLPAGYPAPTITDITVDASNNGTEDLETTQDICIAATAAPGAAIAVYFTTYSQRGWVDLIGRVVTPIAGDPHCSVLSSSFGVSNADDVNGLMDEGISTSWVTAVHMALQDAAMQAVTVCIYSGDQGSGTTIGDGNAHVLYPASDPYVLAVGGTTIGNIVGSSFDEYVWNDTFNVQGFTPSGATGGGVSDFFTSTSVYASEFSYQAGAGVPVSINDGHVGRGVPDVAANASPNSGYPLNLANAAAQGLQNPIPMSGTSSSTPLWAGLIAVINAALGENIGFLNPTLYAIAPVGLRDIVGAPGPANNSFGGATGYPAGPGWDACTGWGSPNGQALLAALQMFFQKSITFVMQRTTFGQDEVAATPGGAFTQAFFIIVDGLTPADFPSGGITTLSPTQTQLNQWAPVIPDPAGTAGPTNITITPASVSSDDPSLSPEIQRFTFTYTITFPDLTAFTAPPAADFPEILTLNASLAATTGPLSNSAEIELIIATGDPFFSSEANGGLYYLSEDIRVFYAEEGSTLFGAPALGATPTAALTFIQWIIDNLSGPTGTSGVAGNTDSFEGLSNTEAGSALSLLPTTFPSLFQPTKNIYNFALARVRLTGHTEAARVVRVFFRLFQSQSVAVPYQAPTNGTGVSATTGAYRQWSDGNVDGKKTPLLGISADGSEYITIPCFASARVANTSVATNMTTQLDLNNVQAMTPPAGGGTVYAYFGCWLDNNQSTTVFPNAPGANPDGPFTGQTLNTVSEVIDRGGHQCLVAEIVDDEAPIIPNATPGTSDKMAQRNLAFTIVANPGLADSRLATHTFEIRPSPTTLNGAERPDELMIDWGNVPVGSTASIYLPAVQAADVLALAARMYTTHNLSASDAHTLQCETGGTTYIPIPQGFGPNYAGLFSVQLPLGIIRGQEFKIVIRQITSFFTGAKLDVAAAVDEFDAPRRLRYVYGAFQISIPVSVKSEMLIPEERNLSFFRWIQQSIPIASRWYPIFQRYLGQLAGRVNAEGGNADTVPPTQTGLWPGLGKEPATKHLPTECGDDDTLHQTGKIAGLIFDRFGDFEGFLLDTEHGERKFFSREKEIEELAERAWRERLRITVLSARCEPCRPQTIIVRQPPAPFWH